MASDLGGPDHPAPRTRLLSNGRYLVVLGAAGTGRSAWRDYALTAAGGDRTEEGGGLAVYLRDLERGRLWSAGYLPAGGEPRRYRVSSSPGRLGIERLDDGIATLLETCVAARDDVEIRRLALANESGRPRTIEVTTYAEVALHDPAAHAAHPAFSRLFVETAFEPRAGILLARRRPRSAAERHPWLLHALAGPGPLEHETDRARFLGRGRTPASPRALAGRVPLSGTTGSVLDPVVSLRRVVRLAPGERARLAVLLGVAPAREAALRLAARYARAAAIETALDDAAAAEHALLARLGIAEARAAEYQELAGAMLRDDPALRAGPAVLRRARGDPATLARLGVRGDGLLAVGHLEGAATRVLGGALLDAHAYWRAKGLRVELVLVAGERRAPIAELRRAAAARALVAPEAAGPVVVLGRSDLSRRELDLLEATAHLVARGALPRLGGAGETAPDVGRGTAAGAGGRRRAAGPVAHDLYRPAAGRARAGADRALAVRGPGSGPDPGAARAFAAARRLRFRNGLGGFRADGREYVVRVAPDASAVPPMPWVNVVANETFGFLVSERGAGCTWSRNSREYRLTPWSNDPVADPYGEALYVRDEERGVFWSPLPGPAPPAGAVFEVRHGLGYTAWRHRSQGLEQKITTFVPQGAGDPVRITCLRLRNAGRGPRRLSLFAYYRLVLGTLAETSGRFVVTEVDPASDALLARNRLGGDFAGGVVFAAAAPPPGAGSVHLSADRAAFLGRHGSPAAPAALRRARRLEGAAGAGLDPCAALQITVRVPPGATVECAFLLGEARSAAAARRLIARYRKPAARARALAAARAFWEDLAAGVQVATPAPAVDLMVNAWLPYQTLSCRMWGRSALYQASGAFGFRDQLQDAAAFALTRPALTRAQILLHAAHQFPEGDVLHWWHPPGDRGTRTRFSDDLLWLPWITAGYVRATGDAGVLAERVPFVAARPLAPGEDEALVAPRPTRARADLYTHCCRAIDRSLRRGTHGLPLMGTGDWNDGMNRVGREGRGESVWLGFFLYDLLGAFAPLCARRGDRARARRYLAHRTRLRAALERAGWDGAWYRRAYYDDGTPLGTAADRECRIDALAQAWAVLSGAAPPARAARAMDAVERLLVAGDPRMIRLLWPPFDREPRDPGYIKGYVPGIRENGGQYTHAALWVVQALARLGRRDRAAALLEALSPVARAATARRAAVYQVEPYVVAADVYGVPPHAGHGGWTWYTGSAGWMYRVAVETILGLRTEDGATLVVDPRIPDRWPGFTATLRVPRAPGRAGADRRGTRGAALYDIRVRNPRRRAEAVVAVAVDGRPGVVVDLRLGDRVQHAYYVAVDGRPGVVVDGTARVPLARDGRRHLVEVTLGPAPPGRRARPRRR